MLLFNISKNIKILKTYNLKKDKFFSSLTFNSKLTNNKTIFIYENNSKTKIDYLNEAVRNKTPAIITNEYHKSIKVPQFIVSDINKEIGKLIKNIYKYLPYKSIAITGTNGKTSVVWYLSQILTLLKYNNATVGTLGYYENGKKINDTSLTTPVFEELYKYANSNTKKNKIFIFEASSHALAQNRIKDLPVNIAAITNITNDHLDYHKTLSEYKKAKFKLFTKHLLNKGFAVINSRINKIDILKKKLKEKNIKAKYFGRNFIYFKKNNNKFELYINKKKYNINKIRLLTEIEQQNLECAITCCLALNIGIRKIIKILPNITNPKGRLQKINYKKKNSKIIIDYAHTPDALKNILISLNQDNIKPSLLFGCGGDRDKYKRKHMGIIANKFASKIYITDDNPRNENPSKIRKNILKYCPRAIEISDRKKAIKLAIKEIQMNEILIVAGKGHERDQIIKNKKINLDDFKVVKQLLN